METAISLTMDAVDVYAEIIFKMTLMHESILDLRRGTQPFLDCTAAACNRGNI